VGADEYRARARATWASGNWDSFAGMISPVGASALRHVGVQSGLTLLDVGTGNGANVAIPAAQQGATVTGLDVTPELLDHARRNAEAAGVKVEWVEGDAQELPFPDDSFDRVVSTFAVIFVPDHREGVRELMRVCKPGGRIAMTGWAPEGFVGSQSRLSASFVPPPPGFDVPSDWGREEYAREIFGELGVSPEVYEESVVFEFPSVEETVRRYTEELGPAVMARTVLEPQGRWDEYVDALRDLIVRFNGAEDGSVRIVATYLAILV
jgi:SAM-dependent methyltransferase